MTTDHRVNDTGVAALKRWIEATSLPDHCPTNQGNLEAWCQEAEESMGNGNPPMVEMNKLHTISGVPETFVIPEDGIYAVELDE